MADSIVNGLTGLANLCLQWVQRELGTPNLGGSAAQAYDHFLNSAQQTANPQKGDIALYPTNNGSSAGHAGVYDGAGNIVSSLSDGLVHVTSIQTLNGYEGNTQPIFVSASSFGGGVAAAAVALINQIQTKATTGTTDTGTTTTSTPAGPTGPKSPSAGSPCDYSAMDMLVTIGGTVPTPFPNIPNIAAWGWCKFTNWLGNLWQTKLSRWAVLGLMLIAGMILLSWGVRGMREEGKSVKIVGPLPALPKDTSPTPVAAATPAEGEAAEGAAGAVA